MRLYVVSPPLTRSGDRPNLEVSLQTVPISGLTLLPPASVVGFCERLLAGWIGIGRRNLFRKVLQPAVVRVSIRFGSYLCVGDRPSVCQLASCDEIRPAVEFNKLLEYPLLAPYPRTRSKNTDVNPSLSSRPTPNLRSVSD